jgi:hypothetical protein
MRLPPYFPLGQAMQSFDEVAPVLSVAFPSTQTVHAAEPRADQDPTGHVTHVPDDARRYLPGSHCLQKLTAVAPVETVELPVIVALHRLQATDSIPVFIPKLSVKNVICQLLM